jgi:hypothetical protein
VDSEGHVAEMWVILQCSCQQWGYGGPDETLARELHRQHVIEAKHREWRDSDVE